MESLKKALELRKGIEGTRGIPDGSGPGAGRVGRGKGGCPNRRDFKSEDEYDEAMAEWKDSQKGDLKKSIELMKAKYTKRTGSPGHYKYEYGSGGKRTQKKEKPSGKKYADVTSEIAGKNKTKKTPNTNKEKPKKNKFMSENEVKEYVSDSDMDYNELVSEYGKDIVIAAFTSAVRGPAIMDDENEDELDDVNDMMETIQERKEEGRNIYTNKKE